MMTQMLMGAGGGDTVTLSNGSFDHNNSSPCIFTLNNDGIVYASTFGGTTTARYSWLSTGGNPANYEAYAAIITGSFTAGTAAAWVPLTSGQTWTRASVSWIAQQVAFTLSIRDKTSLVVRATASITLSCYNGTGSPP